MKLLTNKQLKDRDTRNYFRGVNDTTREFEENNNKLIDTAKEMIKEIKEIQDLNNIKYKTKERTEFINIKCETIINNIKEVM